MSQLRKMGEACPGLTTQQAALLLELENAYTHSGIGSSMMKGNEVLAVAIEAVLKGFGR